MDRKLSLFCLLGGLLTGCASISPFGDFPRDRLQTLVADALPHDDNKPMIYGTVFWRPDARGLRDGSSRLLVKGVSALGRSKVYLLEWDSRNVRFDVTKTIDGKAIRDSYVDHLGLVGCAVVIVHGEGRYDTVTFSHDDLAMDCRKTEMAGAALNELRADAGS